MQNVRLKVCGMREQDNIQAAIDDSLGYMGFIFYPKSSRYVGEDFDRQVPESLPETVKKVGVFVNAAMDFIREKAAEYQLDLLQLHGDESPEYCALLKEKGHTLIKAFGIDEGFDFARLKPYRPYVDYYLFDTKGKERGGNGYTFDWSLLRHYEDTKPIFLSGGLSLENIVQIQDIEGLPIHALDVNSRFEVSPGTKDITKLKKLYNTIKDLKTKGG